MFDWILFLASLIPVPITAYGAFWCFTVRRSLAVRLYRNQALGAGLAGVAFSLFFVTDAVANGGNTDLGTVAIVLLLLMSVLLFYWIDGSIMRARRTDPFLRNTFHWRRVRIVLWADILLAFSSLTILVASSPPSAANGGPPALPIFIFLLSPIYLVGIVGLVLLPIAARKSGDFALRTHLRWFGLFVFLGLFNFLVANWISYGLTNESMTLVANIIAGFCLYRSARSLAPLNRLENGSSSVLT
jgi:hypothetical protein